MSQSTAITSYRVPDVIENLRKGDWLVPAFQREFVWDIAAIGSLATSIIDGYPIGMMTLWDQAEEEEVDHLDLISIPEWDPEKNEMFPKSFGTRLSKTPKAILDGRQRCTALAMLFANFNQRQGSRRYAGRFFLDVTAQEPAERIAFRRHADLLKKGLTSDNACISAGLFPLSPTDGKPITEQWMDYIESIRSPSAYTDGILPNEDILSQRVRILRSAYKGIFESTVAVYTVPSHYDIGKICDIFETLNQTGVKVSTVDLIHSWILTETTREGDPLSVRDWMDEASKLPGAIGWISSERRPELTAQIVTACYVARDQKPEIPRKSKGVRKDITSVKSPDLLNTPKAHWRQIVAHQEKLADYLGDFQTLVANGSFGADRCPYPVSAAIYVALRWHLELDYPAGDAPWGRTDLDAIYRAFFWFNALSGRYDQGFLTQLGSDIRFFKGLLQTRSDFPSASAWISSAKPKLSAHMDKELPSQERLAEVLLNGRPGGARQLAVQLPMIAASGHDIGGRPLRVNGEVQIELHHIFPKKWCKNNASSELEHILDPKKSELNYVDSVSNLMPLSAETNQEWRDMSPGTFVANREYSFDTISTSLEKAFIDEPLFELLVLDADSVLQFWKSRAEKMAAYLLRLTEIRL